MCGKYTDDHWCFRRNPWSTSCPDFPTHGRGHHWFDDCEASDHLNESVSSKLGRSISLSTIKAIRYIVWCEVMGRHETLLTT